MAFKECPVCEMRCRVINARTGDDYVRRRYACDECGHRFTSVEVMIEHGERTGRESAKLWSHGVNVHTFRKLRALCSEMDKLLSVSPRTTKSKMKELRKQLQADADSWGPSA
jgi:MinD superfamily P-loop ATPase